MKSVFDTKPTSAYDDDVSSRYHFPKRYLKIVEECVGDWVVLRRPRADGGNLAYFAVARVVSLSADKADSGLTYAHLADYLEFDTPVPWNSGGYAEEALRRLPRQQVGVYLRGKSVRLLSDGDFDGIVLRGLKKSLDGVKSDSMTSEPSDEAKAAGDPPAGERDRRIVATLTNRIIRDANFRQRVYDANDHRCAITRLRIFDRDGKSEVHAAHIWGVADGGPDVVQNGLALSATMHWLFDRYLLTVSDDYRVIMDDGVLPPELRSVISKHEGRLCLPPNPQEWPHPSYLKRHREKYYSLSRRDS